MCVVIAGGTGFLGRALAERLSARARRSSSCRVTRTDAARADLSNGRPDGSAGPWARELRGRHGLVNLAGAGIEEKRWDRGAKAGNAIEPRAGHAQPGVAAIRSIPDAERPRRCSSKARRSASTARRARTSSTSPRRRAPIFSPASSSIGRRKARDRSAARAAGHRALGHSTCARRRRAAEMMMPFRFFVGGRLGTGAQYLSSIDRGDWLSFISWAIETPAATGAFNATAPAPATNAEAVTRDRPRDPLPTGSPSPRSRCGSSSARWPKTRCSTASASSRSAHWRWASRFSRRTSHAPSPTSFGAASRRPRRLAMRKLKIFEHISLDGVIQAPGGPNEDGDYPYGGWTRAYRDPAGREAVLAAHGEPFDLLLGRRTYDIWSGFWPKAPSSPMADASTPRRNMSRPTGRTALNGARSRASGRTSSRAFAASSRTTARDLILWGSSTLTSMLLEHGLADEVLLFVYPVLLGKGKRFFAEGTPPRAFDAHQHEGFVLRHRHQCLQGRGAFEEPRLRRGLAVRERLNRIDLRGAPRGHERCG